MSLDFETRNRNVTAVLGPTNTGKTHLAIERMLTHESGIIGLPLRLLAREVYDKLVLRVGVDRVALITGEEKIRPEGAKYWVSTVEAMPLEPKAEFVAIDEIQLCADADRGHVFTDRLLNVRGRAETLLLGAATMRDVIADLVPGAHFISRPRLSKLVYAGEKKLTRLPPRSAIVAFSATEVYAIAELLRRQRGGTAVVLGALSPRTRNAQVEMFQSGEVDFLVATDAIGMGLNLNVDHVALGALRKFDGEMMRDLFPAEMAQIAGRAGRHTRDGTFGVSNGVDALPADLIERLETHTFDPIRTIEWRSRDLDLGSIEHLRAGLLEAPTERRLQKARMADDHSALELAANDPEVMRFATTKEAVTRLWDVCSLPDYRKISPQVHAEMVATLYKALMGPHRRIPDDWINEQVALCDRTDGDIDTLSTRLAHIRTWTYVANRPDWVRDPVHWQGRTRAVEDALSDALHEQLTQRFVDRRTSALVRGMREGDELDATIADDGTISVEGHFVGKLFGFQFQAAPEPDGMNAKALRAATALVLAKELTMRARRVGSAKADAFKLTRQAKVVWRDMEIAHLEPGDSHLKPRVVIDADDSLQGTEKDSVQLRLDTWIAELVGERLKALVDIANAEDISGLAKGIGFRLVESMGALKRDAVADDIKTLDQPARAQLRKYGVRFGASNIYLPPLLKPAPAELALVLSTLKDGPALGLAFDTMPEPPKSGLTSMPVDAGKPEAFYRRLGYHICGPRAVRFDMLERLADTIRPLLAFRGDGVPPKGATGDGAFRVTPEMMSILGCSGEEMSAVLKSISFEPRKRPIKVSASDAALKAAVVLASPPRPEDAPPLEPETEEVWRPRRVFHGQGGGHAGKPQGDPGRRDGPRREQGGPRRDQDNKGGKPWANRRRDGPQLAQSGAPAGDGATGTAGDAVAAVPAQAPRPPRDPNRKPWQGKPRDGDRKFDGRRDGGKPGQGGPADGPPGGAAATPSGPGAGPNTTSGNGAPPNLGSGGQKFGDRKFSDRKFSGPPGGPPGGPPAGSQRAGDQRSGGRPFKPGDRRDGGRDGDRRDGRRGDEAGRAPRSFNAAPPTPSTTAADSPFAALMALKDKLDTGGKKR